MRALVGSLHLMTTIGDVSDTTSDTTESTVCALDDDAGMESLSVLAEAASGLDDLAIEQDAHYIAPAVVIVLWWILRRRRKSKDKS